MFGRDNLKDGKKIKSVRNEKGWKKWKIRLFDRDER